MANYATSIIVTPRRSCTSVGSPQWTCVLAAQDQTHLGGRLSLCAPLRVERLVAEYGPDTGFRIILRALVDCSNRDARERERCDPCCPDLLPLLAGARNTLVGSHDSVGPCRRCRPLTKHRRHLCAHLRSSLPTP
jgi:hypothetical protein